MPSFSTVANAEWTDTFKNFCDVWKFNIEILDWEQCLTAETFL